MARVGTLGLGSPWTRDAFWAEEIDIIEKVIPPGYRINVIAHGAHGPYTIVGLVENGDQHPIELFRSTKTRMPYVVLLSMCERLAMHRDGQPAIFSEPGLAS